MMDMEITFHRLLPFLRKMIYSRDIIFLELKRKCAIRQPTDGAVFKAVIFSVTFITGHQLLKVRIV